MFKHWIALLSSAGLVCFIVSLYSTGPPLVSITLPDPSNVSDIPDITYRTKDTVEHVLAPGGESIVYHEGELVTGTLDGHLVGFGKEQLEIRWRIKCPPSKSGVPCRILGLRSAGEALFGVDVNGRLFKFQSGIFVWLLTSKTPGMREIKAGFFNDLVIDQDVIYVTSSYSSDKGIQQTRTMLQRFYSFETDGKILAYNLTSKEVWVFVDKLSIPNGIELHRNNRTLLVAEGSMYRILEVDLRSGKRVGVFGEDVGTLGAVDNIRRSKDGGYWVGISTGRSSRYHVSDLLAHFPTLRYYLTQYNVFAPILARSTNFFSEVPRFYRVDEQGRIVKIVFGDKSFTATNAFSEVLEVDSYLFVGAPFASSVFRIKL